MRKILWHMESCYFPSWLHYNSLAQCTLLELLDVVLSVYARTEAVTRTHRGPRTAPDTPLRGDHIVICGM
jgi:hypothetical protein